MISNRRYCRLMKCMTVRHGGVCHRTSIMHKSGNKMKEKKLGWNAFPRPVDAILSDTGPDEF